jgi:hypothetical protein
MPFAAFWDTHNQKSQKSVGQTMPCSAVNSDKNYDQRHQKRIKIGNRLTLLRSHSHFRGLHFPFPVAKSQSQQPKPDFPSLKIDQSQFPFYPFMTLNQNSCMALRRAQKTLNTLALNDSIREANLYSNNLIQVPNQRIMMEDIYIRYPLSVQEGQ